MKVTPHVSSELVAVEEDANLLFRVCGALSRYTV